MPVTTPGAAPAATARWALAGLCLAMLLPSLGTSVANVALPTLSESFGASFAAVQWVVLAYLLAVTSLVVGAGRLGDLVGRRRLLLAGIAVFTGASAVCGAAPALWVLVAARAAQGVGAAVMMALTLAFAAETVPRGRTGAAMGVLGSASAVGTALGPSLGGVLIDALSWHAIFLVNVPLGVAAAVLAHRFLPAGESGRTRVGFDALGTLLLAVSLGLYALAMTADRGGIGATGAAMLAGALVAGALFVVAQTRARSPLVRPGMLRDRALATGLATSAVVSTVVMATLVVGPFHLSRALGLTPALVGLVMSVGPVVVVLTGIPAGRVADRVGAGRLTVVGLVVMTAGALMLALAPARLGVLGYVVPLAVVTFGYALFQTANNTAVMAAAPADARGVVSGMLNLSRNLGLVTGASAMGAVFALAAGTGSPATAPAGAVATGTHATFAVAAVLLVAALALAAGATRGAGRLRGDPVRT